MTGLLSPRWVGQQNEPGLALRQESVDFQLNSQLGLLLEKEITSILEYISRQYNAIDVQKLPEIPKICAVIQDETNINFNLITCSPAEAASYSFHLNQRSVLLREPFRDKLIVGEQAEFKTKTEGEKGYVDISTGKVGGVFAKYQNTLLMNFNELVRYGMTAQEITAVILHEIGHTFNAFLYTNRMDSANQVITDVLRVQRMPDDKKVEYVWKTLNKMLIKEEVAKGLTSKDPVVYQRSVMEFSLEVLYSQMTNAKYDETSSEQLADMYATRFGYGTYLVSALEKLAGSPLHKSLTNQRLDVFFTMVSGLSKIFATILALAGAGFLLSAGNVLGFIPLVNGYIKLIFGVIAGSLMILTAGEEVRNYTYDEAIYRYNRIRQQVIQSIKMGILTKAQATEAIRQVDYIASILKDVKKFRGPMDTLMNFFSPRSRKTYNAIERQQAIEDLLNNELFVASLKAQMAAN